MTQIDCDVQLKLWILAYSDALEIIKALVNSLDGRVLDLREHAARDAAVKFLRDAA